MAGNKNSGRGGYGEELNIIERYKDLTPLYFGVLKEWLQSSNKEEKMKAIDALKGAFTKMIPQDIQSNGEKLNVGIIMYPQKDEEDTLETTS